MSEDIVIKADNVSKKYSRSLRHVMLYGIQDIGRNMLGLSSNPEMLRNGEFWAVKDTSFEVKRGMTLGIIGPNGSGKSTMLKMLNGIFMPDKGRIEINGRVGALIEVGAGFHPMLTGRENIYVNGAILGMGKKEIDKKFNEIVEFADIGDFIDSPVKHYSSGMYVRLGFAIAVHSEPDILLIDEVLAVGDYAFQAKCFEKVNYMKSNGTTIILVSHDMNKIAQYSDNVLMLNEGNVYKRGDTMEVISFFRTFMGKHYIKSARVNAPDYVGRFGSGDAEIIDGVLIDENGQPADVVYAGRRYIFRVSIIFHKDLVDPIVGFILNSSSNARLYNTHSFFRGKKLGAFKKGERIEVSYKFEANLLGGVYSLTPAISYSDGFNFYDCRNNFITFHIADNGNAEGLVDLKAKIAVKADQRYEEF
jgi:ABC-type polysaccharide/polyol phosphate transport system ATPase subunit